MRSTLYKACEVKYVTSREAKQLFDLWVKHQAVVFPRQHVGLKFLNSGVKPEYTFVVGSPMAEVLDQCVHKIGQSRILEELELKAWQYILLSAHREENIDNECSSMSLMNAVNAMAENYDMPVLYSCHPRSRKVDYPITVSCDVAARVQESHILLIHIICELSIVWCKPYGFKLSIWREI